MQRVAGMTVTVKANGVSEAFYNGQRDRVVEMVRNEMERQKAAMNLEMERQRDEMRAELEQERDWAEINRKARERLLAEKLDMLNRMSEPKHAGLIRRGINKLEMLCAICMNWREMGEKLGLWEFVGDDEHD